MRWSEEVLLLEEEMRRVVQFLDWQASWWREQAKTLTHLSSVEQDGARAYASKQAALRDSLRKDCQTRWATVSLLLNSSPRHPEVF
jgi:hypothetical protein